MSKHGADHWQLRESARRCLAGEPGDQDAKFFAAKVIELIDELAGSSSPSSAPEPPSGETRVVDANVPLGRK